jgi:hypothetical protein
MVVSDFHLRYNFTILDTCCRIIVLYNYIHPPSTRIPFYGRHREQSAVIMHTCTCIFRDLNIVLIYHDF